MRKVATLLVVFLVTTAVASRANPGKTQHQYMTMLKNICFVTVCNNAGTVCLTQQVRCPSQ